MQIYSPLRCEIAQQRIRSISMIFDTHIGNLYEKSCQSQTSVNHLGSALGNRSIARHWVLWLEEKEGMTE